MLHRQTRRYTYFSGPLFKQYISERTSTVGFISDHQFLTLRDFRTHSDRNQFFEHKPLLMKVFTKKGIKSLVENVNDLNLYTTFNTPSKPSPPDHHEIRILRCTNLVTIRPVGEQRPINHVLNKHRDYSPGNKTYVV